MPNVAFPEDKYLIERLCDRHEANRLIAQAIENAQPFLAGRFGSFEGRICYYSRMLGTDIPDYLIVAARRNAGICNADETMLSEFSDCYLNAASKTDLLAVFRFEGQEALAVSAQPTNVALLNCLNPLNIYFGQQTPWTQSLANKTVLVVHPFAKTIERQWESRDRIPFLRWLFPCDVRIRTIKPPNTAGRVADRKENWFEELEKTKVKIAHEDFDVALIGAGAYGLPLGEHVKDLGKVAVHAGGASQLYFGIIGARWEKFFPKYGIPLDGWVRPLPEDTPRFAHRIEGGCYW